MIAIDPGSTGGIAYDDIDRDVVVIKMPDTYPEIFDALKGIIDLHPTNDRCVIEDVGTYMPGNSGPAAVTFARHCGHLDVALYALGIKRELVRPMKWQKTLSLAEQPKKKGLDKKILARLKQERKNEIKEKMQARFPKLKVTLATADALALYCYGRNTIAC
jgi:hypothetical protein